MDRADVGSWIGGPLPGGAGYRGERLGLPETGPGSMASTGRRVVALLVDWFAALLLSRLLVGTPQSAPESFATLGIFFAEVTLFTWLMAASFGQRILGIRVVGRARRLGFTGSAVRTLLICLAVPPLIWDADGRGLHDRAVDSVVVRA
ncbi:MAG TPA: hypothetical protein VF143_13015 [Candidatus Nanopelagicales bacterium]